MKNKKLKAKLEEIACKLVLGLALTEYERALWALYGEES